MGHVDQLVSDEEELQGLLASAPFAHSMEDQSHMFKSNYQERLMIPN
jgi:hypothetical protein